MLKSKKASALDYELLFGVAKAHGFSFRQCREIALAETGKHLREFTKDEVRQLAERLCKKDDDDEDHGRRQ